MINIHVDYCVTQTNVSIYRFCLCAQYGVDVTLIQFLGPLRFHLVTVVWSSDLCAVKSLLLVPTNCLHPQKPARRLITQLLV